MTLANGLTYLAIPGPSVMPERVLRAMHRAAPNIYHGELVDLVPTIVTRLKAVARTEGHVALYITNGHGAWEAAVANTLSPGDLVLVPATGRFAHGWAEIARAMGAETEMLDFGRRSTFDPAAVIDQLYSKPFEMDAAYLDVAEPMLSNEYLVMKNGSKSALGVFVPHTRCIRRIDTQVCYGIRPRNAEQCFAIDALTNLEVPLVTLTGKAGTGKTLLALAAALEMRRYYRQIFISRPSVPLSNKDIGFLPGDIQSKLDPYMQPLYDNLSVIESHQNGKHSNGNGRRVKELLDEEKIVITPLSYIRGRSIVKVFFIVDEAQNLTPHEVKTIITRAGEGTKIVFTGDIYQIDHPYLDSQSNGLSYLIEKMKNQTLYTHINLEKGERSQLSDLAISLL